MPGIGALTGNRIPETCRKLKMPIHCRVSFTAILVLAGVSGFTQTLEAAEGEPLAVRRWPGGTVSIETHWGLHLVINPTTAATKELPRPADQEVRTSQILNNVLFRPPNVDLPMWTTAASAERSLPLPGIGGSKPGEHAMRVRSVPPRHKGGGCLRIEVDGVVIGFVPVNVIENSRSLPGEHLKGADLLILTFSDASQLETSKVRTFIAQVAPNRVLLNPMSDASPDTGTFRKSIDAMDEVLTANHNSLAVSSADKQPEKPQVVTLTDQPWNMDEVLDKLFAAMEKSCSDSQKVFAELSVEQLNFEPANGTHTPRWNCEHMMGRQLLFFSQIYHAIDPTIPVMNLNPKQMPPDYVFAHPDWDGKEEARQMQRVSDFTRRFAYLLQGQDVNTKAPGSNWPTLKALLDQMFRHYTEHTANTVKKFDLPGWPKK